MYVGPSVRPNQIQIFTFTTLVNILRVVRESTLADPLLHLFGGKFLVEAKETNFGNTILSVVGPSDIPEITPGAHCKVVVVPDWRSRPFD